MQLIYIFGIFLTLTIGTTADIYIKTVNRLDSDALCLDGQQAFVYLKQGQSSSPSGLLVYFMGLESFSYCGGATLFASLESCLVTQVQISSFWSQNISISDGILTDQIFKEWAKVIIPYCDGALFQGYAKSPTKYKNKDLFFRGNKILRSNLAYIDSILNISKLSKVVVAGSGIGAIGAMTWSRYFREEIVMKRGNLQYQLIVDSYPQSYLSLKTGLNEYQNSLQNMVQVANIDEPHPFSLCSLRNQGQEHKCFLFSETYFYINFAIMSIESQYDPFTVTRSLQISCIDSKGSLSGCSDPQRKYLQLYRSSRIVDLLEFTNFKDNSFWSIACSANGFLLQNYQSEKVKVKGSRVSQSVAGFVEKRRQTSLDGQSWPSNQGCSGLQGQVKDIMIG